MRKDRIPHSWTPMKYIKDQEDTIYLMKWQLKFNSYLPNNIKKFPFCKTQIYFWKHFIDCNFFRKNTENSINFIQNKLMDLGVQFNIKDKYHKLFEDINWNFIQEQIVEV